MAKVIKVKKNKGYVSSLLRWSQDGHYTAIYGSRTVFLFHKGQLRLVLARLGLPQLFHWESVLQDPCLGSASDLLCCALWRYLWKQVRTARVWGVPMLFFSMRWADASAFVFLFCEWTPLRCILLYYSFSAQALWATLRTLLTEVELKHLNLSKINREVMLWIIQRHSE